MMKFFTLLAPLLASGALAQSELAECFRDDSPDWNDCETLRSQLGWASGDPTEITHLCGKDSDLDNSCMSWFYGYCQIGWCFTGDSCAGTSIGRLVTNHIILKSHCENDDTGGRVSEDIGYYEVIRNRNAKARGRHRSPQVVEANYTRAEYEELFGHQQEIDHPVATGEEGSLDKRQDVTWINLVTKRGVTKPNERIQVSQEVDSGVEYTWQESSSESVSIGTTAGVSAGLFEIFSASVEISTTYETTYTVGEQLTYTSGNCPGSAIVYWHPVFDQYGGIWSDDTGTNVDIWVARELNGEAEGRFVTECVGTSPP